MAFVHGKDSVFKLDNASGSLTDISSFVNTFLKFAGSSLGSLVSSKITLVNLAHDGCPTLKVGC